MTFSVPASPKESMDAHPMLTPLLPLQRPATIAVQYSADAATAYTLIWNNTLGHLRGAKPANESVVTYRWGDLSIGVRALWSDDEVTQVLAPELDKLRVARQAIPVGARSDVSPGDFHVESLEPVFWPAEGRESDLPALIAWLDALQVASPGRQAEIIDQLQETGWLQLVGSQYRLTERGAAQIAKLDAAGLHRIEGAAMARWRLLMVSYASGDMPLEQLVSESNRLFGVAVRMPCQAIDELVTGEHTSEEVYALRDKAALKGSSGVSLPASMDPHLLLARDDPLRQDRDRLEGQLAAGRAHQWLCLSVHERAAIRMGALLSTMADEVERERFCASVVFDARQRWLIGLGAEASPPSETSAARSFAGWAQAMSMNP